MLEGMTTIQLKTKLEVYFKYHKMGVILKTKGQWKFADIDDKQVLYATQEEALEAAEIFCSETYQRFLDKFSFQDE